MGDIHPTAIVHPEAIIGEGSTIGAYSIIGPHVCIGERNRIGPHVVIEGYTTIGHDNQVFQFASIGSAPQDLKFGGERTEVVIGNRNCIREYVTIQPGTVGGQRRSVIGDGNLFMVGAHVAHDAIVGNSCVFANYCSLAGHVEVGDRVTIGGLVGVHQFVRIGALAILSGGAMCHRDVPPFLIAQGDRGRLVGLNRIGLHRAGISGAQVKVLKQLFRAVFHHGGMWRSRIEHAREILRSAREESQEGNLQQREREPQGVHGGAGDPAHIFMNFLEAPSKRGYLRGRARHQSGTDEHDDVG